ncbi:cytochrome b/b6 domain-containing protein [Caenispirillum bisanense]|uniref:cytochrome b/b6 domain-containing protein n=1 Tax=Caenispirillum bisanense TaxID=414052 RepID=UPI0031E12E52
MTRPSASSASAAGSGPGTAAAGGPVSVRVWDLPTRLFHWVLVLLIAGLWWTGTSGTLPLGPLAGASILGWTVPTGQMAQHMLMGYAVLTLVIWRLLYGLVGSSTSRFAGFVRGPAAVIAYLRGALGGGEKAAAPAVLGHNPAGGWMILVLLAVLAAQATTGLFSNDDIFTDGPLVRLVSKETSDSLTGWHKNILFPSLLALIALHVAAALFYLAVKRDNLIRAMVTGRKTLPAAAGTTAVGTDGRQVRFASPLVAVAALAVAVTVVWAVVTQL